MAELEGKTAVITGAGSGMARATARVFVREGAQVLGADISGREEETAEELGEAFVPFHANVSVESDVEAMFAAALGAFGHVDAVLNVAGIGSVQRLVEFTIEEYDRTMSVNLLGVFLGMKHGIRAMLPTGGGAIVNVSSTGGLNASRLPVGIYSASKAGVNLITKQAAVENAANGIRVNAICPGTIVTELSGGEEGVQRLAPLIDATPMKRPGQPEEIAELACFLASDRLDRDDRMTGRSLTDTVRAFTSTQERLVPRVSQPDFSRDEWSPLTEFVDVEAFQRVGTEMELQDWDQFLDMLTNWASHIEGFDAVVRGTSELPGIVYFEVEEHHRHGGGVMVVNSLSVFEFNPMDRISQIRVYLQRAPTGQ